MSEEPPIPILRPKGVATGFVANLEEVIRWREEE
jgi:hypothetical protein